MAGFSLDEYLLPVIFLGNADNEECGVRRGLVVVKSSGPLHNRVSPLRAG